MGVTLRTTRTTGRCCCGGGTCTFAMGFLDAAFSHKHTDTHSAQNTKQCIRTLYMYTNIDRGFTYNVHLMRHVCSLLVEHHLMQCTNKLPSVGVPVERGEGMYHYKSQLKINSLCNCV